ncbi:hypothetical protein ACQEVF_10530 [Nonomuraea polychroma]
MPFAAIDVEAHVADLAMATDGLLFVATNKGLAAFRVDSAEVLP